MTDLSNEDTAIELLQSLGLKEYEAKSFVALTRLPSATAKQISEISEVPRTRVCDAVRVLESKGLVEIQHGSPQEFRAVGITEAAEILRTEYVSKTDTLREALEGIEPVEDDAESESTHEVWALTGSNAVDSRRRQLLAEAEREAMIVLGSDRRTTDDLLDALDAALDRGVSVLVGTATEDLSERVRTAVPDAEVFVSDLAWLHGSAVDEDTEITRALLVDRSTILVSTAHEGDDAAEERAVFGRGFDNGFVTIVRRLMATGLLPVDDLGAD